MSNNELQGTLVLVHPGLQNDPAGGQGKVGILTYIDLKNDAYVRFGDNTEAVYSPGALLQLKSRAELFPAAALKASELRLDDYKDLYKISLLQDMGRSTDVWKALEIAGANPAIWSQSLSPIANTIPLKMEQSVGR